MTKIKSIVEKTFQGKVTGHTVVLDDGTTGNLADKKSDTGLVAGDEVVATVEDYVSKAGNHSNLITLNRATAQQTNAPTAPQTNAPTNVVINGAINSTLVFQERCKGVIKSMELTIQAVLEDKLTFDKVKDQFKEVNTYVQDAINEIITE
jgi:hypothetical protein